MRIKQFHHGGWENNLQLANDKVEALISLDVGPRILSYNPPGGDNVLKVFPEQLGTSGETEWKVRGGHRLWLAPEDEKMTYVPDNVPVKYDLREPNAVQVENAPSQPWGIRKQMEVSLSPDSSELTIVHRAINEGSQPVEIATWGLTVMEPGGLAIIPLPPLGEHPRDLLPNRVMVVWPYADLSDPRWRFGWRYITLRQASKGAPTKLGLAHKEKWVGYLTRDALFIKTFDYVEGEKYPDLGCNFETFSNSDMLELESLSPLRILNTGEQVSHIERWYLFSGIPEPNSLQERDLAEWIKPRLSEIGL
jgi:hypothetical protein